MTSNDLKRMLIKQKFQRNMLGSHGEMPTQIKTNINGRNSNENENNCEKFQGDTDIIAGTTDNFEQDFPASERAPLAANYSYCTPRSRTEKKGFIVERKKLESVGTDQITGNSTEAFHAPIPINEFTSSQDRITFDKGCYATSPNELATDEDMKYTDITHLKLKNSLDQIQGQSQNHHHSNSSRVTDVINSNAVGDSHFRGAPSSYDLQYSNSKYYAVLKIKDSILQEKESIILKLKFDISTLQHMVQERDLSIRKLLQSQEPHFNNKEFLQLHQKVENLEKLLEKNEFQLSEVKISMEKERKQFKEERNALGEEVKSKNQMIMDTKRKAKFFSERLEKYKKRVESLERYLGDLPTIEETNRLKTETDILGVQRENMISEVFALKNKLEEKTKLLHASQDELKDLIEKGEKYLKQILALNEKIEKLENSKKELGMTERDELESYKLKVNRLERERVDAAKMFSVFEQKSAARQQKHREEVDRLKKKVEAEEQTTLNVKKELESHQQSGNKIHSAMVNLSSQNQKLRDEKMELEEQVASLKVAQNDFEEKNHVCLQLQNETFSAVKELKQISQVLLQTADGQDPNFSLLFGVETSDSVGGGCGVNTDVKSANKTMLEVRNLRRDLEQLRTMLSNRYAENLGENCTTQ